MGVVWHAHAFFGIKIGQIGDLINFLKSRFLTKEESENAAYVLESLSCKHIDENYKGNFCLECGEKVEIKKEPNGPKIKSVYKITNLSTSHKNEQVTAGEEEKIDRILKNMFDKSYDNDIMIDNEAYIYMCTNEGGYDLPDPIYYIDMNLCEKLTNDSPANFQRKIDLANKWSLGRIEFYCLIMCR
jgi:hypothetical protein